MFQVLHVNIFIVFKRQFFPCVRAIPVNLDESVLEHGLGAMVGLISSLAVGEFNDCQPPLRMQLDISNLTKL